MANKKPSIDDLKYGIEHVVYEYEMYKYASSLWEVNITSISRPKGLTDLILESALTHLRNLIEFYSELEPYNSSIIAGHYGIKSKNLLKNLKPHLGRLNEQISHLSYSRINKENHWQTHILEYHNELNKAWEIFLDEISPEFRILFDQEIAERKKKINRVGPTDGGATGVSFNLQLKQV
jgi:hypothetical protein